MARIYWMVLIFGVAVSLIWWPGMKNEAYIFSVIEKEREWQVENLGFDLVSTIDKGMMRIQSLEPSRLSRVLNKTLPWLKFY